MPDSPTTQPYFTRIPLSREEWDGRPRMSSEVWVLAEERAPSQLSPTIVDGELQLQRNTFLELTRIVFPYLGDPPPEGISVRYVPELNILFDALGLHESSSKPAGYRYDMYVDGEYFPFYSTEIMSQENLEWYYESFSEGMAESNALEVQKKIRQQDDCATTALTSQPTSAPTSRPVEIQPTPPVENYPTTAQSRLIFGEAEYGVPLSGLEQAVQKVTSKPATQSTTAPAYHPQRDSNYLPTIGIAACLAVIAAVGTIIYKRRPRR